MEQAALKFFERSLSEHPNSTELAKFSLNKYMVRRVRIIGEIISMLTMKSLRCLLYPPGPVVAMDAKNRDLSIDKSLNLRSAL